MTSTCHFRCPGHVSGSMEETPADFDNNFCHGRWHLLRTSNRYWKGKINVHTECDPSGKDCFFYQTQPGGSIKTLQWNTKPVTDKTASFLSQGTGMLRFVGAPWEVIGWSEGNEAEGSDQAEGAAWMVVYQQSTMLTGAAVNVSCRTPTGISDVEMGKIDDWLRSIDDDAFQKAVEGMFPVSRQ